MISKSTTDPAPIGNVGLALATTGPAPINYRACAFYTTGPAPMRPPTSSEKVASNAARPPISIGGATAAPALAQRVRAPCILIGTQWSLATQTHKGGNIPEGGGTRDDDIHATLDRLKRFADLLAPAAQKLKVCVDGNRTRKIECKSPNIERKAPLPIFAALCVVGINHQERVAPATCGRVPYPLAIRCMIFMY